MLPWRWSRLRRPPADKLDIHVGIAPRCSGLGGRLVGCDPGLLPLPAASRGYAGVSSRLLRLASLNRQVADHLAIADVEDRLLTIRRPLGSVQVSV